MDITIYHNPRCSKSRQALQLLRDHDIDPVVVEYLKSPPDSETLSRILDLLGMDPRDLMRTREKEYKALGLNEPGLSREALVQAMVEHPRLIERPIVVRGNAAALGRPPERVLDIL